MLFSITGRILNEWPERSCLRAAPTMPHRPHPLSPAASILPVWGRGTVRAAIQQSPPRELLEAESSAAGRVKRNFWNTATLANLQINGCVELWASENHDC